jgi:uncharacterized protein (TIGR02266 family)
MKEFENNHIGELRNLIRLPVDILVQYSDEGKFIDEFCNNISIGGLFIETINMLNLGTKVDLKVTLPHNHLDLFIAGEVIWVQDKFSEQFKAGMGIKFLNISTETQNSLRDAIEYYNLIRKKVS